MFKINYALLILISLFVYGCDLLTFGGDPTPPLNELSVRDSLAVRAILDTNGLKNIKVKDVISLQDSKVGVINLDSVPLTKFIFTSAFDSLDGGITLNIFNNQLDSMDILDTINSELIIQISNTSLKNIPDNISLLKGRLFLYLADNKLKDISSEIFKCQVSYIDVQYNDLCSVSDTLNNWIIKNSRNNDWKLSQTCP